MPRCGVEAWRREGPAAGRRCAPRPHRRRTGRRAAGRRTTARVRRRDDAAARSRSTRARSADGPPLTDRVPYAPVEVPGRRRSLERFALSPPREVLQEGTRREDASERSDGRGPGERPAPRRGSAPGEVRPRRRSVVARFDVTFGLSMSHRTYTGPTRAGGPTGGVEFLGPETAGGGPPSAMVVTVARRTGGPRGCEWRRPAHRPAARTAHTARRRTGPASSRDGGHGRPTSLSPSRSVPSWDGGLHTHRPGSTGAVAAEGLTSASRTTRWRW